METYENLVGNQEDWASYITNVEMRETPFLDWLPVGDKPTNVLKNYQADKYAAPRKNSHVDGKPWGNFKSAGDGRGSLKALVQWFDNTSSVSKLTQDVSNPAGVVDELARDIPKRLKEMATDAEANFQDDWDCREDNKVEGYLTRTVGSWISADAQALYPVPADFRPPASSILAGTTVAAAYEDNIRDILESMANVTKSKELVTAFMGSKMKRKFSDFQFWLPNSATTQSTGGVQFTQSGKDKTIVRAVDYYESDFGPVEVVLNYWLAAISGTATARAGRAHFLHRSKWEVCWNQKPKVYHPEFKGGSYEAAMDMILMLVCKNPAGEGKFAPA